MGIDIVKAPKEGAAKASDSASNIADKAQKVWKEWSNLAHAADTIEVTVAYT